MSCLTRMLYHMLRVGARSIRTVRHPNLSTDNYLLLKKSAVSTTAARPALSPPLDGRVARLCAVSHIIATSGKGSFQENSAKHLGPE